MSKPIYLFKEHENFQVGKTTLQKGAVFGTRLIWISFVLIIAIGLIALAGNNLRLQWRYETTGQETTGTVIDCDQTSNTTFVYYHYQVQNIDFNGRDEIGRGKFCANYPTGAVFPVYYLSDAPIESGIGAFMHKTDWTVIYLGVGIGFAVMGLAFLLVMKNRKEQYKYALLQRHANTLIEAEVSKVGRVTGKNGYNYADYSFTSPDMGVLTGQIRSGKGYRWPKQLQRFDKLQILYLDSESYCVL